MVWTREWSSWVSVLKGNLYSNRPWDQAGRFHHLLLFLTLFIAPSTCFPWEFFPCCPNQLEESLAVRVTAQSACPCKPQLLGLSVLAASRAAGPSVSSSKMSLLSARRRGQHPKGVGELPWWVWSSKEQNTDRINLPGQLCLLWEQTEKVGKCEGAGKHS